MPKKSNRHQQFLKQVYDLLEIRYGKPACPLNYNPDKPYELAIAVILSAQCTDERVNQVTRYLFREFNSIEDYYKKPLDLLEKCIYSTGFYKNKARNIRDFMFLLDKNYAGRLPADMQQLVQFPGIGRKTANVILNEIFHIADGIVVDTHVARIVKLWGLTDAPKSNAVKIERDLMKILPGSYWLYWSLYLIFLGREFCKARTQLCGACFLNKICPAASIEP